MSVFKKGDRVVIVNGPWQGVRGQVIEVRDDDLVEVVYLTGRIKNRGTWSTRGIRLLSVVELIGELDA